MRQCEILDNEFMVPQGQIRRIAEQRWSLFAKGTASMRKLANTWQSGHVFEATTAQDQAAIFYASFLIIVLLAQWLLPFTNRGGRAVLMLETTPFDSTAYMRQNGVNQSHAMA